MVPEILTKMEDRDLRRLLRALSEPSGDHVANPDGALPEEPDGALPEEIVGRYIDARVAGLCHEGALETVRDVLASTGAFSLDAGERTAG